MYNIKIRTCTIHDWGNDLEQPIELDPTVGGDPLNTLSGVLFFK